MLKRIIVLLVLAGAAVPAVAGVTDFDVTASIATRGLLLTLVLVFVAGIMVSLTPCVYPMIPITLSIIGARSAEQKPIIGFLRSLVFVLGLAFIYSLLGYAGARSGKLLGFMLQNKWFLGFIALFFIVMGVSMLGLFEIQVPARFAGRLQSGANRGGFIGAFLLGIVTGIVASPCGSPVLFSVLSLATRSGQAFVGISLLFVYAVGIGMLFLVLGTFPAFLKSMPRSGGWMEDVKIFLGLLLIGVAVYYYLGLVLPVVAYWVVAVAASLVGAVYIAVRSGKEGVAPGLRWFWRLSGAALVVFAVYAGVAKVPPAIAGGAHEGTGAIAVAPEGDGIPVASAPDSQAGAVETSAPVEHVAAPESPTAGEDEEWLADEAEALAIAKREKRPVVVDFGAAWCAACKELEKITFAEERVKEAMKNFVKVRIDCTEETEGNAALRQKYGALALPTVAFIGANGELQSEITLRKFEGPDKFLERLKKVPQ